jgi:hypothetical protein
VRQTRTVIALSTSKEDFRIPLAAQPAGRENSAGASRAASAGARDNEMVGNTIRGEREEHKS